VVSKGDGRAASQRISRIFESSLAVAVGMLRGIVGRARVIPGFAERAKLQLAAA
jgi:hypothetical protein